MSEDRQTVTREKQIEEMQNALIRIAGEPYMIDGLQYWSDAIAEKLYDTGYRKASDMMREVIDVLCELHDHFKSVGDIREAFAMLFVIAELKKKYTESEDEE